VQNRVLGFAVEQAYHGFMKERRYPIAVIDIKLPLADVDVNFHPGKAEVRFRDESAVFGAVQRTVREAVTLHSPVPEISHTAISRPHTGPASTRPVFWPVEPFRSEDSATSPTAPLVSPALQPKEALPALRVLGQVQSAYVAAEGPDGMYLIDQHAAHERIVFERVMTEAMERAPQVQSLLEPALVELGPEHRELLREQAELIAGLGMVVEPFGDGTYLLRGVPALLAGGDPAQALTDVLDTLADGGGFESWDERAAYSIACHGAIRAGMTLSLDEMTELARQLEGCREPNTCPHGRPTMIHLSSSHLEREFGRT
jgi:DNA mismatch repair protein MutL